MINEIRETETVQWGHPLVIVDSFDSIVVAVNEIDWDEYENCGQCRGRAEIEETDDGDLFCQMCRAQLPKPVT
ncbi:MAG: hypothetical protein KIH69_011420 [Anaerolineae bacterium]|nr:hypothetical protein [Anaerolineae bacterium]